jgi:D-alanine-D-alanine ligase
MHGPFGEDGTVQGLLDAVGLPYTGSGVLGSALAMDKVRAKLVYRALGLPTPESESIDRLRWRDRRAEVVAAAERLGYPCVVKPARSGSSVGVSFPGSAAELASSLDALLKAEEHALAEKKIEGRELTCGILEIAREQRVFALPVTEIKPNPEKYAYFDYEAKYTPGASLEITPAEIPPSLTQQIQTLALAAHRALDCRDFSRTDVLVGGDGQPVLLETNTIPGLTPTSLLPQAAKVAGYDFPRLISILIDNAIIRA